MNSIIHKITLGFIIMGFLFASTGTPLVFANTTPFLPGAVTCTWDNSTGNWNDQTHWSCGSVPGAGDTAIILSGTVNLNIPVTVDTLTMDHSGVLTEPVLTGDQSITITHLLNWNYGSFQGTGLTTINAGATLVGNLVPALPNTALSRPFVNNGTVNWFKGTPSVGPCPTCTFTNNGTFNILNANADLVYFAPYIFINNGSVHKTTSSDGSTRLGGVTLTNNGLISVDAGGLELTSVNSVTQTTTGDLHLGGGNLVIKNGFILNGGTVTGSGTILMEYTNPTFINHGGAISPGGSGSAGTIIIDGNYVQQAGGALNIEIGGTDLRGYDSLIVTGTATLSGALDITKINFFNPALSDGFAVMRYASLSGSFSPVSNPLSATHPLAYGTHAVTLGTVPNLPFQQGDIFVGVGAGKVKHLDKNGILVDVLDTQTGSAETGGFCWDADNNLYVMDFQAGKVSRFNRTGTLLNSALITTTAPKLPESCVVDASANLYVGHDNGFHNNSPQPIIKYDLSGTQLDSYTVAAISSGSDNIAMSSDQHTILYNSEGTSILRYDTATKTQLSAFATNLTSNESHCYDLKIRANGEVITACGDIVYRLNSSGGVIQTYTAASMGEPNTTGLYAISLDPDGVTFWTSANYTSGLVHQVNIDTGALVRTLIVQPYPVVDPALGLVYRIGGITLYGEQQVARPGIQLVETVGTVNGVCAGTREISIAQPTTVTYCYTVTNTGSIPLTVQSLTDTVSGVILTNQSITLAPGASYSVKHNALISGTTVNVATWTATSADAKTATTADFTRVNLQAPIRQVFLPKIQR